MEMVDSGEEDPAVDISPHQESESFSRGPDQPDRDLMYERLSRFAERTAKRYPSLILEQAILDHTAEKSVYSNSNAAAFDSTRGSYNIFAMFTSKDGAGTSSFNYSMVTTESLEKEIWEMGTVDTLMEQSTEQTATRAVPRTFTGDLIVTPDCLADFVRAAAPTFGTMP